MLTLSLLLVLKLLLDFQHGSLVVAVRSVAGIAVTATGRREEHLFARTNIFRRITNSI